MKLILTRHGETEENINRIIQGHGPGRLSGEGKRQAKKVAERLKDEKIDVIYSSDLTRASDTAEEIAKFHEDVPIYFVKELRERDLGSLVGENSDEINWEEVPEDVENFSSMRKRIKIFLDKVYKKYPDGNVLFVGHSGINKALITIIMNKPAEYLIKLDKQFNTCINIFTIRGDENHEIHLMNCVKHLK